MTLHPKTSSALDPTANAPYLWRQSAGTPRAAAADLKLLGAQALFESSDLPLDGGLQRSGLALAALPTCSTTPPAEVVDHWCGLATAERGITSDVHWASDGHHLFGSIDLPEAAGAPPLEDLSQRAYGAIFETLRETGMRSLLRIWNYVPRINEVADGTERYQRFNSGRQRAFVQAGWSAFEGAPAASAVGSHGAAPLQNRFLASRSVPVAVENPRQVSAYRYPAQYGPASPTFSRAALVAEGSGACTLFISGTASIIGHESVHLGDAAEQTRESWRNLLAILDASKDQHGAELDLHRAAMTVYVRNAHDADIVHHVLRGELGAGATALDSMVLLHADICRAELLVEIEAVATGAMR